MFKTKIKNGKPLVSSTVFLAAAVSAVFLVSSKPVSAPTDGDRPSRGSVNFGASSSPKVDIPPAMQGFATVFADVAEKVVPTVVSVIPTKIDTVVFHNNPFYHFFNDPFGGGNPFDDFFGGGGRGRRPQQPQQPQRQERRQQGLGSGVIVSRDGYILTNCHVVQGANEIEVKTTDGRSFEAELVGSDSLTDVAVLKIKEKVNNLPVAFLGNSDKLRPGDWAVAIGNPFSLTSSVTMGIVSAVGRAAPLPGVSASYQDFIQTDAAINPGNSGGALVNIKGELIGINTMIYTQSGGSMGIGFAIPINMARRIMEDLIYDGKVSRGWLGVSIQELDPSTRAAFNLAPETKGVLVGDVHKGQPADKAGIKRGDVITKIDGRATENLNQLRNQIAAIRPGKKIPVEIMRNGKKQTVQVTLTSRDESLAQTSGGGGGDPTAGEQPAASDAAQLIGIKVGALTSELRDQLNLARNINGVVVTEVTRGGQAAHEGIRQHDVILEVNRKTVPKVSDFNQAVKNIKTGDNIVFLIQRDGNTFYRAFRIRK